MKGNLSSCRKFSEKNPDVVLKNELSLLFSFRYKILLSEQYFELFFQD